MGALLLLLLGIVGLSSSKRDNDQNDQVSVLQTDQFVHVGDFKPIEIIPAVRAGATCWTCGRSNDGHQHL
jgi:hypothetical protein